MGLAGHKQAPSTGSIPCAASRFLFRYLHTNGYFAAPAATSCLQQSLEGLDRGTLSPDYVHVHAQSVAQRLAFLERYTPMVTGESSLAGHQRDIASVADAAAAVAAAAQAAAAAAAGTPGTGRQVADMGAGMSSGGGAGGMPYSGAAQQYEQRPATAPAAAAEAPYGGGADGYGHGGYEQGHGYGHDGRVVPYGRGRQQGRYQYVPPAELWRRRSSAAEVALRRRLGGALERSYQQTTELLVPPGAGEGWAGAGCKQVSGAGRRV